jgi:hypothetical protein
VPELPARDMPEEIKEINIIRVAGVVPAESEQAETIKPTGVSVILVQ